MTLYGASFFLMPLCDFCGISMQTLSSRSLECRQPSQTKQLSKVPVLNQADSETNELPRPAESIDLLDLCSVPTSRLHNTQAHHQCHVVNANGTFKLD